MAVLNPMANLFFFGSIVLLMFVSSVHSQVTTATTVSCNSVPTGGYLESTPYTTSTKTILKDGESVLGVYTYYKSITYVSDCNPSTSTNDVETTTLVIW